MGPAGGKPSSVHIDHKYLVTIAAAIVARNLALVELRATTISDLERYTIASP